MMVDRVLLLDRASDKGQRAHWPIKDINDTALENYKDRLDIDIHKFAKVLNMSDGNSAGNVSGESVKYKLFTTGRVASQKQRKSETSLQKRIKLILSILSIKGSNDFNYRDISTVFNDNKPYNELDNINTVKVAPDAGLSRTYAYGKLRDIDGIQEELDRQSQEVDAYSRAPKKELEDDGQKVPEDSDVL